MLPGDAALVGAPAMNCAAGVGRLGNVGAGRQRLRIERVGVPRTRMGGQGRRGAGQGDEATERDDGVTHDSWFPFFSNSADCACPRLFHKRREVNMRPHA
jgi:hypothetical protein